MDHKREEKFFAVVSPGLEQVCATELEELGCGGILVIPGGVEFEGRLGDLYRANLELRTASRVLVRFATFRCRDFPDLFRKATRLPWGRFVKHPDWLKLRAIPEYADKKILSNITNIFLKPASCSQI